MFPFTAGRARRQARTSYYTAIGGLDAALRITFRVSDPAARSAALDVLSEQCAQLAKLEALAFRREPAHFAQGYTDDSNIAWLLAGVEAGRALGRARLRRGPDDFEQAAGALLDELADPEVDDARRAAIYHELCTVTAPFCKRGHAASVLIQQARWYQRRARPHTAKRGGPGAK